MSTSYTQDNVIQWIFEKAFDQLTLDGKELLTVPFDKILSRTFESDLLAEIISKLCGRPLSTIQSYIHNRSFVQTFLFEKIKNKINVAILTNDLEQFNSLIKNGHKPNSQTLNLTIINGHHELIEKLFTLIKPTREHLECCAENGQEKFYFELLEMGITPNLTIYRRAVAGGSIRIVQNISKQFGLSRQILRDAFETNQTDIIIYLIEIATREKIKISPDLISYPVLNHNLELLDELEKMKLVKWNQELYYSAILSGSMDMVRYLETKIPNIHEKHTLDTSKTGQGKASILLDDVIYQTNGKKYFSHTMNYAVQSGSIEMVQYVHSLGYGITVSNLATAVRQSTSEILQFLLNNYSRIIPRYLIYYLGVNSYVPNKLVKAKILIDHGILNSAPKRSVNEYKKDTLHSEIISQTAQILSPESIYDLDYLMKYHILFENINWLVIASRLCAELCLEEELKNILEKVIYNEDQQAIIDILYLFGNLSHFQNYYSQVKKIPSPQIIMESMCYCQTDKLQYLMEHKIIDGALRPLSIMLGNSELEKIFGGVVKESDFGALVVSGNKFRILDFLDKLPKHKFITMDIAKNLLKTEDADIIRKCDFSHLDLKLLVAWAKDADLEIDYDIR